MRLALYEPDIPQNMGALIRLGACFGTPIDVIEPCGFPFSHRGLKRAGMDYMDQADLTAHASWTEFEKQLTTGGSRLILLTTRAATPYADWVFEDQDVLMVGRESAGVPEAVHDRAHARLLIPMVPGARSLNVAQAAAIVLAEALRQTGSFPAPG